MAGKRPTDEDRVEALRRLLSGLTRGEDAFELAASVEELHPKYNTFPGEVFSGLAADALEYVGASRDDAIAYEGLYTEFLPECEFRGRQNHKIQYAVLTSAALRGGLEPDLLGELYWWQTDDYWRYALYAAVALIRAAAHRRGISVAEFAEVLAAQHDIDLT